MLLSIIVILALLIITYVHYLQGFFSATLSAICAVAAAVLAFSLHETLVESFLGGKMANFAHSLMLLAIFPVIYLLLRTILDKAIPGQIRLPSTVDKVGGALMGLVAAIFGVGIVVIAAEELPFGPSVMGYSRYALNDVRKATLPVQGRASLDAHIEDELKSDTTGDYNPADALTLLVPVDDIVIATVKRVSDGSLAGNQRLTDIHPDFLQETFGQRLGIEPGGKRVALNLEKQQTTSVTVKGVYSLQSIAQADPEIKEFRPAFTKSLKPTLTPKPDEALIVVRVMFNMNAADSDGLVRFSPGSVRLVTQSTDGGSAHFVDNYPIGALQGAKLLYVDKLDDPLFVKVKENDSGADLVFRVHRDGAFQSGDKNGPRKFADGTFIEVKRLGRESLAGKLVDPKLVASADVNVMRKAWVGLPDKPAAKTPPKPALPTPATPTPTPAPPTPATPTPTPATPTPPAVTPPAVAPPPAASNSVLKITSVQQSDALPVAIAIGPPSAQLQISLPNGAGDVMVKNDRFLSITMETPQPVDQLKAGPRPTTKLLPPKDQGLVVVEAEPANGGWTWAERAADFDLVDAAGQHYKAIGAWATVQDAGTQQFIVHFSTDYPLSALTAQKGTVTKVWLCFALPANAQVKQLMLGAQSLGDFPPVKVSASK